MSKIRNFRTRTKSLLTLSAVMVAASVGVGVAVATTNEPFVYDSTIDETVPADLDTGLADAIGDPNSATGDGGTVVGPPPAEPAPAAYGPTISNVDTDGNTPPPYAPDVFIPTNAYSAGTSTAAQVVYAGADGGNPNTGMIIDSNYSYDDSSTDTSTVTTVAGTGAITFTDFSGNTLFFTSSIGQSGSYDLSTQTVTLCGPPLSERICPA